MSTQQSADEEEQNYMVEMSTSVGYFDKFLEAIGTLRDEGKLIFGDDRVYSEIADPSNVAMCVAKIEGQALNSLKNNTDGPVYSAVDIDHMRNMLKSVSNSSEMELRYPKEKGAKMMFRLDIIDEDLTFEIPGLDPDTVEEPGLDEPMSHETQVVVSGSDIKSAVKHAGKIGNSGTYAIHIATEDGTLKLFTDDKVNGSFVKRFHQSGPTDGTEIPDHETMISLDYLEDIDKVLGRGKDVTIHIRDSYPIRFDVDLDENGDAKIIYVVAPRQESS